MIVDELGRIPMSPNLAAALQRASDYAAAQSHVEVTLEHLLLALTQDPDAGQVLGASNVDVSRLEADVSTHLGRIEERFLPGEPVRLSVSGELKRILEAAAAAAVKGRRREINGAIVMAAIVGDGRTIAAHMLRAQGLTFDEAIRVLRSSPSPQRPPPPATGQPPAGAAPAVAPAMPGSAGMPHEFEDHRPPALASAPQRAEPTTEDILAGARERVQSRSHQPRPQVAAEPVTPPVRVESPVPVAPPRAPFEPDPVDLPRHVPPLGIGDGHEVDEGAPYAPPMASRSEPPRHYPRTSPSWSVADDLPAGRSDGTAAGRDARGGYGAAPAAPPDRPAPQFDRPPPDLRPVGGNVAEPWSSDTGAVDPHWAPLPQPQPVRPAGQPPALPVPTAQVPLPSEIGAREASVHPQYTPPPMVPQRPPQPPPPPLPRPAPVSHPQRPMTPGATVPTPPPMPPAHGQRPAPVQPGPPMREPPSPPPYAPWPEMPDQEPEAPPVAARKEREARGGRPAAERGRAPQVAVEAGQLVENVPRRMRVAVPVVVEARIARASVRALAEGLQGGGDVHHHDLSVTRAMSVRLRAPEGGFWIETASPETQWIENVSGLMSDDYASWRWTVTPQQSGRRRLQLVVSARTVGVDGLTAETALPDQIIDVRIGINYAQSAKRWGGWALAALAGGLLQRFGEGAIANGIKSLMALVTG